MAGQLSGLFLWLFKVSCAQPNLVIEMHLNPALPLVIPATDNKQRRVSPAVLSRQDSRDRIQPFHCISSPTHTTCEHPLHLRTLSFVILRRWQSRGAGVYPPGIKRCPPI